MRSPFAQFVLIALATLSAFTLGRAKSPVREATQMLFVPVAGPVRAIGQWAGQRVSPAHETDPLSPDRRRSLDDALRQNAVLLTRLANLQAQFDDLKQLSAQYRDLDADLQKRVHPAAVLGGSATGRQTLVLGTSGLANVRERQAVMHPAGFVGQIYAVATGGATARVLLATDPESKLSARFVRFAATDDNGVRAEPITTQPPLVEGDGHGLVVRMLPAREVRTLLRVGDVALLNDPAFPLSVKGLRLGTVRKITLPPTDAGHATIELDPTADFGTLREVLVVDK